MRVKKGFKIFYLLISEGTTEFNIFAYLTTKKFRYLFEKSNVQFSVKAEIIKNGNQIVSQGKLGGVGSLCGFQAKYNLVKSKYVGQRLFVLLDKDLDESEEIGNLIRSTNDVVQFLEYNSEYLLLKLAKKKLRKPSEFASLNDFRTYCKSEFYKVFRKKTSDFKDSDFDQVFALVTDEEVRVEFKELFATLDL